MKALNDDPLLGLFEFNVIIDIIYFLSKCNAFNFGSNFWCLSFKIIAFVKLFYLILFGVHIILHNQ
jgi:hypothetical protein